MNSELSTNHKADTTVTNTSILISVKVAGFCFEAPAGPEIMPRGASQVQSYRLRLLNLALTQLARDSSTFLYNTCRSYFAPIITTPVFNDATQHPLLSRPQLRCSYGGGGGYCPRVQFTFRSASSLYYYLLYTNQF